MGSRGRSIRLRIYVLVAIPLITMLGLFGYVAYTSVTNWLNLDRAPTLIQQTSEPLTDFVNVIQAERRAAVVYLSQPNADNLAAFTSAVAATKKGAVSVEAKLTSPTVRQASTPAETTAIDNVISEASHMDGLRAQVTGKKLAPLTALAEYTDIIAGQGVVLQAEANSIQDSAPVIQGLGLISGVNTQEDVSEQDAVLASALVTGALTPQDRVAFSNAVGRQQNDTLSYQQLLTPAELVTYQATMNKLMPNAMQQRLSNVQQAVPGGASLNEMQAQGLSPQAWHQLTGTYLKAASTAGNKAAIAVLAANSQPAVDAKKRVVVLAAVGAAGLILTLLVSLLLGRSINRRLGALRRSALTLATEQLPSVVSRLRRGESVDVAAEAPPLRAGNDEIGQVGQAIDTVRQTAIRSAVDEARVRQGVNDMFRNLARRNQSLLQRQLTVLDEAEHRTTDPDVLEDLFKMDHLTTRMRRHAEGLIILSGAPPGRSWSAPVKLIDVMRGAVAEVEDYARVTVSTQARAALAGSAVTDVIHLLAELVENATTLSPPFTQVRVNGELVANGFAIEIEDRGLGMNPQRQQELNDRLANPPDLNPANTEQLGLFVVGQLARRHGIRVMLRTSPYGGTTAIALLPTALIVEQGPAAITSGSASAAAADPRRRGASAYDGPPGYERPGYDEPAYHGPAYHGSSYNGAAYGEPADNEPSLSQPAYGEPAYGSASGHGDGAWAGPARTGAPEPFAMPAGRAPTPASGYPSLTDPFDQTSGGFTTPGFRDAPGVSGAPGLPGAAGGDRGRHGFDDVPVVTGVPVGGQAADEPEPPFDVFAPRTKEARGNKESPGAKDTPLNEDAPGTRDAGPGADSARQAPFAGFGDRPAGFGSQPAAFSREPNDFGSQPDGWYVSPYADPASPSYQGDGVPFGGDRDRYRNSANIGIYGDESNEDGGASGRDGDSGGSDVNGLPRRVRQANLAPQLRAHTMPGSQGPAAVPPASAASLADMRNTLSAMQRGWQEGRSRTQRDTEGNGDGQ